MMLAPYPYPSGYGYSLPCAPLRRDFPTPDRWAQEACYALTSGPERQLSPKTGDDPIETSGANDSSDFGRSQS